jgi:hypothetical protein
MTTLERFIKELRKVMEKKNGIAVNGNTAYLLANRCELLEFRF